MTARRYLVLLAIVLSAAIGDVLLSVGMRQIGAISAKRWLDLLFAIRCHATRSFSKSPAVPGITCS